MAQSLVPSVVYGQQYMCGKSKPLMQEILM